MANIIKLRSANSYEVGVKHGQAKRLAADIRQCLRTQTDNFRAISGQQELLVQSIDILNSYNAKIAAGEIAGFEAVEIDFQSDITPLIEEATKYVHGLVMVEVLLKDLFENTESRASGAAETRKD